MDSSIVAASSSSLAPPWMSRGGGKTEKKKKKGKDGRRAFHRQGAMSPAPSTGSPLISFVWRVRGPREGEKKGERKRRREWNREQQHTEEEESRKALQAVLRRINAPPQGMAAAGKEKKRGGERGRRKERWKKGRRRGRPCPISSGPHVDLPHVCKAPRFPDSRKRGEGEKKATIHAAASKAARPHHGPATIM